MRSGSDFLNVVKDYFIELRVYKESGPRCTVVNSSQTFYKYHVEWGSMRLKLSGPHHGSVVMVISLSKFFTAWSVILCIRTKQDNTKNCFVLRFLDPRSGSTEMVINGTLKTV